MGLMLSMKARTSFLYFLCLLLLTASQLQSNLDLTALDDSDMAIEYAGDWSALVFDEAFGSTNAPSSVAFDRTVHQTQDSTASIILHFQGTFLCVYGQSNPGGNLLMTYSIDGGAAAGQLNDVTLPLEDGVPAPCLWFRIDTLLDGNHSLVMKMNDTLSRNAAAYFIFDYFVFGTTSSGAATLPQSQASVSSTSATQTGFQTASESTASEQTPPPTNAGHTPVAAIVGAVLGAFSGSVVLFLVWYWHRVHRLADSTQLADAGTHQPNPFPYSPSDPNRITPAISKKASASANAQNDPVKESENARLRQRIDQLEREMAEVQALYPDMGRRNAHVEERRDQLVSEVPPSYN